MQPATINDAISLASEQHRNQTDKIGEPYIYHPLRVMLRLKTEEERIVGVLHDLMEDCAVDTAMLLKLGFTKEVVTALTFLTKKPEEENNYHAFIERIRKGPTLAIKVKIADIKDNLDPSRRTPDSEATQKRVDKYERALVILNGELSAREKVPS